jgi:hypothetical protein
MPYNKRPVPSVAYASVQQFWEGPRGVRVEPAAHVAVVDRTVIKGREGRTLKQLIVSMPVGSPDGKVVIVEQDPPCRVNGAMVRVYREGQDYVLSMKPAGQ